MISMSELNLKKYVLDEIQEHNLNDLLVKINKIRLAYNKPMVVSSGLRSREQQINIYRMKAKNKEFPFENGIFDLKKVPLASKHLIGAAVDIADNGDLMEWCKSNIKTLEEVGLWVEEGTVGWVHFQTQPPKSGNRFFRP